MRAPALLLPLLLALPAVLAAPVLAEDPAGDQTTYVASSGNLLTTPHLPTPCAAPATDILRVVVDASGGVVTLGLVLADPSDEAIACGLRSFPAEQAYAIDFQSDAVYGFVHRDDVFGDAALVCDKTAEDFPCDPLGAVAVADGQSLTWTFPEAGTGWDLAGHDVEVRAGTASYAHRDPWGTGVPTLAVHDGVGAFPATL